MLFPFRKQIARQTKKPFAACDERFSGIAAPALDIWGEFLGARQAVLLAEPPSVCDGTDLLLHAERRAGCSQKPAGGIAVRCNGERDYSE
jgi:hypothetical protein